MFVSSNLAHSQTPGTADLTWTTHQSIKLIHPSKVVWRLPAVQSAQCMHYFTSRANICGLVYTTQHSLQLSTKHQNYFSTRNISCFPNPNSRNVRASSGSNTRRGNLVTNLNSDAPSPPSPPP